MSYYQQSCSSLEQDSEHLSQVNQTQAQYQLYSSVEGRNMTIVDPYVKIGIYDKTSIQSFIKSHKALLIGLENEKENICLNQIEGSSSYFEQNSTNSDEVSSNENNKIYLQSKMQVLQELKLFRIFKSWKSNCKKFNPIHDIIYEENIIKQQLKHKFIVFKQWKRVTIMEKRAKEYHNKRIFRIFFMTVSELLQIRFKTIYLQEMLKFRKISGIMEGIRRYNQLMNQKAKKIVRIVKIRSLVQSIKSYQLSLNSEKLASLHNEFRLKKKCVIVWKFDDRNLS